MAIETVFQHWVFTKFILPFLLIFAIVFAILEKTKVFGDDKKQTNAIVSIVIGLIFVGFAYPKDVVQNMILFLTVALIVSFVVILLWGFVSGGDLEKDFLPNNGIKAAVAIFVLIAVAIAVIWATGFQEGALDFLFGQSWSNEFWTNALFIGAVVIAIVLVMKKN
ncbi:MAG TPA: hypothetical protein VJZ93_00980 [Candidatus Nanoarchaeia archaeon]|nr:hypothetical protein [Candidatus Nanoarchaeia archaeon]